MALQTRSLTPAFPLHDGTVGEVPGPFRPAVTPAPPQGDIVQSVNALFRDLTDPAFLGPMLVAQGVFGFSRLGLLKLMHPSVSRPAAVAAANLGAFGLEGLSFVGSARGLHQAMAGDGAPTPGFAKELGHAYLTLGLLKTFSGLTHSGLRSGYKNLPAHARTLQDKWLLTSAPQAAQFFGIYLSHSLAPGLGLGEYLDPKQRALDSAVTVLHFGLAGRLLGGVPGYARLNQKVQKSTERWIDKAWTLSRLPAGQTSAILSDLIQKSHGALPAAAAAGNGILQISGRDFRPEELINRSNGGGNTKNDGGWLEGGPQDRPEPATPEPPESREDSRATLPRGKDPHKGILPPQPDRDASNYDQELELLREGNGSDRPFAATIDADSPSERARQGRIVTHIPADFESNIVQPGFTFGEGGKYQVQKLLGEGGMGAVYQVYDSHLGRDLAMKILKGDAMENNPHLVDRFNREIRIVAQLDRRYTVMVHELTQLPGGQLAILMELVPGHDLDTIIDEVHYRGRPLAPAFPLDKQIEVFAKICEAVHATHELGIIHRDLKPANIRLRINNPSEMDRFDVLVMDYGIATLMSPSQAPPPSRTSIRPEAFAKISPRITQEGRFYLGTPGFIPPESLLPGKFLSKNPRSGDIFAAAVVGYELFTGQHPFEKFRPGDPEAGEALKVSVRPFTNDYQHVLFGPVRFPDATGAPQNPPTFREVMAGEMDPVFYEIGEVIMRGMALEPSERYQSMEEFREAILEAPARVEKRNLDQLSQKISELERRMAKDSPDQIIPEAIEETMMEREGILREYYEDWKDRGDALVIYLNRVMGDRPWPSGQRMIAELSWEDLLDGGDLMSPNVRKARVDRIIANDVITPESPIPAMAMALRDKIETKISFRNLSDGSPVTAEAVKLRVIPLEPETDASGRETRNYLEGEALFEGDGVILSDSMKLGAGYYVFEVEAQGYAPMRVPVQVRLNELRDLILKDQWLDLDFELVPLKGQPLPPGFTVVHRVPRAVIGHDFRRREDTDNTQSFPMREIQLPTLAVSQKPVSVGEYAEFIRDRLAKIQNFETEFKEIEAMMPRSNHPAVERPNYWFVKFEGEGSRKKASLVDPTSHKDPFNDPIFSDQPISAIPARAAQAYIEWRAKRDALPYRMLRSEEKEVIARNGFPWKYPWGNGPLRRSYVVTYRSFSDKNLISPQPIGSHPLGAGRDYSLHGIWELLGNVREFTQSPLKGVSGGPLGEKFVFLTGGSIRDSKGAPFNPAGRSLMGDRLVQDSMGKFRLVLDLVPPPSFRIVSSPPQEPTEGR